MPLGGKKCTKEHLSFVLGWSPQGYIFYSILVTFAMGHLPKGILLKPLKPN